MCTCCTRLETALQDHLEEGYVNLDVKPPHSSFCVTFYTLDYTGVTSR